MPDSRKSAGRVFIALLALSLGACAQPGDTANAPDPFEGANRAVHSFNKGLDRSVVKPASEAYVRVVPRPVRGGVSNGVNTLSQPIYAANHVLQGDFLGAVHTAFRFGTNVFVGFAGIADPATQMGLYDRPTDFGETLAVWGVDSGPYVELPFFGPSTVRDTTGLVVDFVADPYALTLLRDYTGWFIALEAADALQQRNEYSRLIEALLYESADSYNAARIAYLQNRAATIGGSDGSDGATPAPGDLEDPYAFDLEDPYATE
ncbi:MlaA family lipoprotein [Halovulum sp. GXIMD14794]